MDLLYSDLHNERLADLHPLSVSIYKNLKEIVKNKNKE
jgi:hypothetical protein